MLCAICLKTYYEWGAADDGAGLECLVFWDGRTARIVTVRSHNAAECIVFRHGTIHFRSRQQRGRQQRPEVIIQVQIQIAV